MVRKQRNVCRTDRFLPDSLKAPLVQVHLAAVFVDDILGQHRRAVAHEIGLEVIEDNMVVILNESVDDTMDQQVVAVLFPDFLEDPAGGNQQ